MAIDGATTPFGAAPPDFNATALTPASALEQTLVVQWPSGEAAPFSSASASGYVLDLSKTTIGTIHDIYSGPAAIDLKSLPASPLITTTGAGQTTLQLSIGSTSLTTGISMFATARGLLHRRPCHAQRHAEVVHARGRRPLQQREQHLRCRPHQHVADAEVGAGAPPERTAAMPWQRRAFSGGTLARAFNIADLRVLARRRVPHFAFEYVEGGAEDEATLRNNRAAFDDWRLLPRTLVDTTARSLRSTLFGHAVGAPLVSARPA